MTTDQLEMTEDRNAMSFGQLAAWAWRETPPVHKNGTNLLIHLFAVPLFVIGNVLVAVGIFLGPWFILTALLCIVVSLSLQKFGHSLERTQVPSFAGPRDFLRRLYAEQLCNFWRFLVSGQWYASFKARHENAYPVRSGTPNIAFRRTRVRRRFFRGPGTRRSAQSLSRSIG